MMVSAESQEIFYSRSLNLQGKAIALPAGSAKFSGRKGKSFREPAICGPAVRSAFSAAARRLGRILRLKGSAPRLWPTYG